MAKQHLPACFLAASHLLAASANSHLPELFGREYLRVDPLTFRAPQNPRRERVLKPPGSEEGKYEAQVRELELAAGPYSQGLADPLTNLFHSQLDRGDTGDAIESLRRAIQLIRVNDGLNSHLQLPLLRQLIDLYRQEADYASLGEVYRHYYRVASVGRGPFTETRLAAALEYLDWERQLYASRDDGAQRSHLLQAYEANHTMLEDAGNADPTVFITLAMSQLRNLYLILGDKPLEMGMTPYTGDGSAVERRLSTLQKTAYGKGRQLLQECIERSSDAAPGQQAEIHLEMGDWLHWNGRPLGAEQEYARVIELMDRAGNTKQLGRWFDEPVELPNKRELWPLLHEDNQRVPMLVKASYEVNSKGESRRVEVSVEGEEAEWQASKIRSMLRDTHFRPRIGREGPEAGPRVTRYYRLISIR